MAGRRRQQVRCLAVPRKWRCCSFLVSDASTFVTGSSSHCGWRLDCSGRQVRPADLVLLRNSKVADTEEGPMSWSFTLLPPSNVMRAAERRKVRISDDEARLLLISGISQSAVRLNGFSGPDGRGDFRGTLQR